MKLTSSEGFITVFTMKSAVAEQKMNDLVSVIVVVKAFRLPLTMLTLKSAVETFEDKSQSL